MSSPSDMDRDDWSDEVVLRDGATITIRRARPEDQYAVERLLQDLSRETQESRFGEALSVQRLNEVAGDMCRPSPRFTLLATLGDPERVVAEGGFVQRGDDRADLSITVSETQRGRGIATHLLGALAQAGRARGIQQFAAVAAPENYEMVNVVAESGFPVAVDIEPGGLTLRFPTQLTPNAIRQFELRDRSAAAQALRQFYEPESVAVIGASRDRASIPGTLFHNLFRADFHGPVYPVNHSAGVVQSVLAYQSVEDVPGDVDLAIIAVPARFVPGVVEECARKGVPSLLIITAGFAETGEEGRALQDQVLQRAHAEGMRIVGPNCMGMINTDPEINLNATFATKEPPRGNIAFASQSGALGMAIIEFAEDVGLGISSFVSLGNKADISGNDMLCYWAEDERTEVILLYLESFGNPRKFSQIARDVGLEKPIVAVKSGRSSSGQRAASSHTGALLAASDTTVDALFRQSGVIRTDTLEEMFEVAGMLSCQPLPRGERVGIITNAGGPGILCADALEAAGVAVPEMSARVQDALRRFLPAHAGFSNPVDLIASATAADYQLAVETVLQDEAIDAVIVINIPIVDSVGDVYRAVQDVSQRAPHGKPLLFVSMTSAEVNHELRGGDSRLPIFTYPEAAARALARGIDHASWQRQPHDPAPEFDDIRPGEAASIVAGALDRGEEWLDPATCWQLLECYGIPIVSQRVVESIDDIPHAARQLGSRVALKAFGPDLLHKTELGAVTVNLEGPDAAVAAAHDISRVLDRSGLTVESWILQAMAEDGVEMLLGAVHDPQFGPVVACGAGGVMVELMQDISFRLAPLSSVDAAEMVTELKSSRLLTGFRGDAERDIAALENALLRLGRLVDDLPQIAELDCNPVFVHTHGATVVDARIRISG